MVDLFLLRSARTKRRFAREAPSLQANDEKDDAKKMQAAFADTSKVRGVHCL